MTSRVFTAGIIALISVSMIVFMLEFFLPLSAKSKMDNSCRLTLLRMEDEGGLTEEAEWLLSDELAYFGFQNIIIEGTDAVKQGDVLTITVQADYHFSKITGLLKRHNEVQHMTYERTAFSRKVVN